jgi:hypothetical protein
LSPYRLTGIVVGTTNERTAILERTDGSVYFVGENDALAGMKIISIRKESVDYFFSRQEIRLAIEYGFLIKSYSTFFYKEK